MSDDRWGVWIDEPAIPHWLEMFDEREQPKRVEVAREIAEAGAIWLNAVENEGGAVSFTAKPLPEHHP